MQKDNKYVRFLKNTGIVLFGSAGSKLLVYLLLPFYTSYLSPAEYGVADLVITYATMLLGLVTCQIQEAIFVYPKGADKAQQSSYFSAGITFLLSMYCIVSLIAGVGYCALPESLFFRSYMWYIVAFLFLDGVQLFFQQFCRSIDRMVLYALSGVACSFGTLLSGLLLIPEFPSGTTLILTRCIGLTFGIITPFIGAKMYRYIVWSWKWQFDLKPLLWYALPMIPSAVMWWAISSLNKIFISNFLGLEAVGIFGISYRITSILFYLWNIIGNAWQISVLEEFGKAEFSKYFNQMFDKLMLLHLIIFAIMAMGAPLYMRFYVAPEFYQAYYYIPVLAFAAIFSNAAGFLGTIFSAARQTKYYLYSSIASLIVIVPANVIGIYYWGLMGAALAVLVTILVQLLVRCVFVRRFFVFSTYKDKGLMLLAGLLIIAGGYVAEFTSQMVLYFFAGIILLYFIWREYQLLLALAKKILKKRQSQA